MHKCKLVLTSVGLAFCPDKSKSSVAKWSENEDFEKVESYMGKKVNILYGLPVSFRLN